MSEPSESAVDASTSDWLWSVLGTVAILLVAVVMLEVMTGIGTRWWQRLNRNREIREQRREQYLRNLDPHPDPSDDDDVGPHSAQGR